MEFDLVEVLELDLVEVLAHERSLMLAIVAHLPFPSLAALESTSSQIYQLFSSYGVWKVVFRRLAAKQPFYNWELRFSVGEQLPGEEGGAQESGRASEKTGGEGGDTAADQAGEGGRYAAGTVERVGAGGEDGAVAVAVGGEQANEVAAGDELEEEAGEGGKLDGEKGGEEGEGAAVVGERNFKRWVVRLLQLEERWRVKGPVSEVSVEVAARSEIAAIAIDEAALLLGLRPTGRLQLYTRVGKLILEVEIRQQIASVALTPDLFIAGSLKTDRFYNPSSPVVCFFHRSSGVQVHVVSLQGSLTTNLLLPGSARPHLANEPDRDQLLLVLHTPTPTQTATLHPTSSVYSISPSTSATLSLSTRHLYSLPDTTLMSKQCLHPDKSKFLFFSPSSSSLTSARPLAGGQDEPRRKSTFGPRVNLLHLSTGLSLAQFSLTSPLPLAQMGFFSPSTVFMLHKATYIDSAILVFFNLKGEVEGSLNLPTPFTHEFFSTFSSLLLTTSPSPVRF